MNKFVHLKNIFCLWLLLILGAKIEVLTENNDHNACFAGKKIAQLVVLDHLNYESLLTWVNLVDHLRIEWSWDDCFLLSKNSSLILGRNHFFLKLFSETFSNSISSARNNERQTDLRMIIDQDSQTNPMTSAAGLTS